MSQEWYYSVNGDRQGPITAAELKKLAEGGTLKPTDLVWKDGMGDWAQAKTIKGLFGAGGGSGGGAAGGSGGAAAGGAAGGSAIGRAMEKEKERSGRPSARDEDDDDRPRRRPRDEEDKDSPRRRARDENEEDEDRPVRSRRRDNDDEEEDRPARRRGGRVPEDTANKKMVAGLLGILLGGFAVHKFYLGFTGTAVIQLLISLLTCGLVGWLGLIEGIIYLTKSDEDFHRDYVVNQKQWF